MADFEVKLRFTADGQVSVVTAAKQMQGAVASVGPAAKVAGEQARQGFGVAASGAVSLGAEINKARNAVAELVGALGGMAAAKRLASSFIEAADAAGQLESRMRLATASQTEYAAVMDRVQAVARASYVSINDIAEVYIRSIEPMRQLGYATQETLDLTEAMSLALVVSAADAQKRATAIDTLSKVMQTGTVRMQEFLSLANNAPRFMSALEESTGKTRAQLLTMVSAGELTAGELAKVGSVIEQLRDEVESMPTTVEDATIRFRDAFQMWAGAANEGLASTHSLVVVIDTLSKHINAVMTVAISGAIAAIGLATKTGAQWLGSLIASQGAALRLAQANATEAKATLAAAQASVFDAGTKARMAASTQAAAAASQGLAAAKEAETAALAQANLAQKELDAVVDASRVKILSLNTAIGAATAAMIGWNIGSYLRDQFESVRIAADILVGAVMEQWNRLKQGTLIAWEAVKGYIIGSLNTVRQALATMVGLYASALEKLPKGEALASSLREIEARLRPASSAAENFRAALARINESANAQSRSIWGTVVEMVKYERQATAAKAAAKQYADTGVITASTLAAAFADLAASVDGEMDKLEQQNFLIGKGTEGQYEWAKAIALAKAETITDADAKAQWIAQVEATYNPLIAQARANDAAAKAATAAADASRRQADELKALAEATAAFAAESDRMLRDADIAAELDDLTRAGREFAAELEDMTAAATAAGIPMAEIDKRAAAMHVRFAANVKDIKSTAAALRDYVTALKSSYAESARLAGMTEKQRRIEEAAIRAVADAQQELAKITDETERARQQAIIETAAKIGEETLIAMETARDAIRDAFETSPILNMIGRIGELRAALEALPKAGEEGFDPALTEGMQKAIDQMNAALSVEMIGGYKALLGAMQGFTREGSKSFQQIEQAMAALSVVQAALATADAVRAILSAAAAPWPLNFPSMAAMAAAVAPLLSAIGAAVPAFSGGGGPSANSAAYRQERQGTGTVLGDSAAKSESIARAVEITANATQQLVGINRSMLNAMQAMAAGLSGAGAIMARGAGGMDVTLGAGLGSALSGIPVVGNLLGGLVSSIFGGKESLRDQGIRIVGGVLSQMIDDIMVQSYQSIHRSGGWFGSSRDYDRFADIGDGVARQFQLVLDSMADAVRAAADALGMDMDAINAAIAQYQIAEIRISTMDLSAEEAQAELEAVFSSIFDGLAGAVVPFVAQFQQVGEGLGETLIRVATSVQVTQEAVRQLGISLDETDPERLAQISVGLVDLMGGIEDFISGMSTFVSAFAPESHKFAVAQDALTRAFEQFGMTVPESRDAMWELMQGLDATTESGRQQIAMLLQLAEVSDSYYSMLEDQAAAMARIDAAIDAGAWDQYLDTLTDSERAVAEMTRYYDDWHDSLIAAGATLEQLAAVEDQRAAAMGRVLAANAEAAAQEQARLEDAGRRYADFITGIWRETVQLSDYQAAMMDADSWRTRAIATAHEHARAAGMAGASEQALVLIELRASQLRAQALAQLREETQSLVDQLYGARGNDIGTAFTAGMESASNAAADYWEQQRRRAETLQQYLDSMLLGDLSALSPAEQLAEAWDQLNAAVAGGDADQATRLADVYLRMLREMEASGDDYNQGFWQVRELLQGMLDGIGPIPDAAADMGGSGDLITAAGAEQIAAQNRLDLAVQLAEHLADLSEAVGQTVWELMDSLGVDLHQLTTDLGISLQTITGETVLALVNMSELLGTNLLDLTSQLGLQLTDLGAGIRELAEQTGINLDALTVESVQALGGLANQLGIDLADIATSVGADLGNLADAQSLLNQALQAEILKLPDDQARALQEYFDNIVAATSEADANEAIDTMAGYINSLDADIRDQLAPYFDKVFPAKALTDLDYLTSINRSTADMATAMATANGLLTRIADNAMAANSAAGIPSYAVGTGYVPSDGLAMIHQGETIIPAPFAAWMRENGLPVNSGGGDNTVIVAELRNMSARLDRIERATTAGAQQISSTVAKTGEISDRNADASRARHALAQRRGVTA